MKTKLHILLVCLALVALHPSLSIAKTSRVIHIKANSIAYDRSSHLYVASGHCIIHDSTYTIQADKISVDEKTTIATLRGHIKITDKTGNWIKGTYGVINLTTYRGYINHVTMFNRLKQLYVKAKKIIMDGENKYYLRSAFFSGCACKKCMENKPGAYPKWSIEARNTYIVRNEYLFSYPAVFRIRKTPVAAIPVFEIGLNNKRRSGLLMPSVGYSSSNGISYSQPVYWAISNSQDITITPYIMTTEGKGTKIQYRFYWTRNIEGSWNIDLFQESRPYASETHKKTRINLKAWQTFQLSKYGLLKYNLNLLNNKNNLRVLNNDNLTVSGNRYTVSTATYSKTWPHYALSINGYYYQDLTAKNNNYTVQKLPEVDLNINNQQLYKNLTLDMSNSLTYYYTISDIRSIELRSYPQLSYPLNIHHINIMPSVGLHNIYADWWTPGNNKATEKGVFVPEYSTSISTSLFKIYNLSTNSIQAIKHTITPTISYSYIPNVDQSQFPSFISTIHEENLITLTVENTVDIKYLSEGKTYRRKLLYAKVSQSYDLTHTNYLPNYSTPPSDNAFPPLYEEVDLYPLRFLTLSSKAHISTKYGKLLGSSENVALNTPRFGGSVGYITIRDPDTLNYSTRSLSFGMYVYPTKGLYLAFSTEKDLLGDYYPSTTYTADYKEDCWGVGLTLFNNVVSEEKSDGIYSRKRNIGFWITVTLKGIGTLNRRY